MYKNEIPSPLRVFLIEDSEHDAFALRRAFAKGDSSFEVIHFVKAEEALAALKEFPPPCDIVLADYKLPGMNGLELCRRIIGAKLQIPCVLLTGAGSEPLAVESLKAGVSDYLVKDMRQHYLEILPLLLAKVVKKYRKEQMASILSKEREAVAALSELFLAADDLEVLYEKISPILAAGMNYPIAAVLLFDENKGSLIVKGISGQGLGHYLHERVSLTNTACGRAVLEMIGVLEENISKNAEHQCFLKDRGVEICLSVPIKGKKEVLGSLIVADSRKRCDTKIHIPALQVIANHLGLEIERKKAEEELKREWQRCWSLLEELPAVLWLHARDMTIKYCNKQFRQIFGEPDGKYCYQVLMGREEACACCPSLLVFQNLKPEECDCRKPINGRYYKQFHYPLKDADGSDCVLKFAVDMTSNVEMEMVLQKAKEEWEKTFDAIHDIITIQDKDLTIVRANKAAHDFFEMPLGGLVGSHCYEIFRGISHSCSGCPLPKSISNVKAHSEIIEHTSLGKTFFVSSSPVLDENNELQFLVHIAKDITEQKKLEEEIFQAHKMEAIGTLAGGIAHDFNNILSAVIGFAELARMGIETGEKPFSEIDEVLRSSKRAANLVKQILSISRKNKSMKDVISPYYIVKEALKLMRASLPTTIEIQKDIDPNCGTVRADPTTIHQVVVNLCTNALHAMEEETGMLKIKLGRTTLTAADVLGHEGVKPGPFVELAVSDNGCGIDKETMKRIFDPYFTTKEVGKGTGLGLSIVHGIVKDCRGMITVDSESGKGSTFRVYFPALDEAVTEVVADKEVAMPTGNERILVVDDEETIATFYEAVLSHLGYEVITRFKSTEALELFRLDPQGFDLLITDQAMPFLSGANLAKEVLLLRPDMSIILCTGYSSTVSEEKSKEIGIRKFLDKPVERVVLAKAVREVLDGKELEPF